MYTVVITEAERARMMSNEINKSFRHCKIGKVVEKRIYRPVNVPGLSPYGKPFSWPDIHAPFSAKMDKCGCKVGSVCNNVACPHRLIATCNTSIPPIVPAHGTMM
jgi:hypothetical protein